ncbi:hematopoietic prostaglandin D synthase-like [Octodon degus]|uniref:glutathione transferase n=1 Tax=Octodon degus TaxID=10160 RepID=A0A6P6DRI9_OCTDE|nr:hematopoietic prostaglandin D synthase-like [Octodon degus]
MKGKAEIIHYIFAYLNIKYEDHRIEHADWPAIKSTLPFGKIPVLEVDGLILHQSLAIARYLTKNTAPGGSVTSTGVLSLVFSDIPPIYQDDFYVTAINAQGTCNHTLHVLDDRVFSELLTCEAPPLLQDLETYLEDKEWFIGNSVTWADFYWDICSTTLLVLKCDMLDSYHRLSSLWEKVQAIPAIAGWLQQRPQSRL